MTQTPPAWDPQTDDTLVCVAIRAETHDISSFVFAPLEPRLFRFAAGQFMTLELGAGEPGAGEPGAGEDGVGVQRCYTIASPPTRPWRIEVTAKRMADGAGSGWLHREMRPGMRVRAAGPMGDFTFTPTPGAKYLFLCAGSGITPLMSMARSLHDLGSDADVLFVHSAHTPADLVFADELAAMARRPGFRPVGIVTAGAPGLRWDGLRGRLSPSLLALLAPDLLEREVFCCGPASYMAAVRAMLDAAQFDRSRYHEESFAFAAPAAPAVPTPDVPAPDVPAAEVAQYVAQYSAQYVAQYSATENQVFSVQFARTGRLISCPPGITILAAARAAGIRLPSACAKGVCGTCKSRLLSGSVEMRHGGGIRQREIDQGLALLCCARPTSDVVVDR